MYRQDNWGDISMISWPGLPQKKSSISLLLLLGTVVHLSMRCTSVLLGITVCTSVLLGMQKNKKKQMDI